MKEKLTKITWDRALITDCLSEEAVELVTMAVPCKPQSVLVAIDHDTPSGTVAVAAKQKKLRDFARTYGTRYAYGQGIGYHLLWEQGLEAGEVVICAGRHAAAVGAFGALGVSLRPEAMKAALESGEIDLTGAEAVTVCLYGTLPRFVSAKDLALTMLKDDFWAGKYVFIGGAALTEAQRITVCMLLSEGGAAGVCFTEVENGDYTYDLSAMTQMAVYPDGLKRVASAAEIDGLRVNQVFIGGCAGGTIESLRKAAQIWEGKTVSKYVRVMVAPATAKVYAQALDEGLIAVFMACGALVMPQGCSACWAQSQGRCDRAEIFATTGCMNRAGWVGAENNGVWITSTESAARAALTGMLYEN